MGSATSTLGLLERFQKGDTEAFTLLFRKYHRRLWVLVYYKMGPEMRAKLEPDDVVQEVFLEASRNLKNFTYRSPGSLMGWLSRIADHVIVDESRYQNRGKRQAGEMLRFRSESNPGGPEPADTDTPSRIFARAEGMERLLKRLNALPLEYKEVILLAKFEGQTTAEMAERLGKSRENIALTLHRALKRFRELDEP